MDKRVPYVERIRQVYPDLVVRQARFADYESEFNTILIINEDLVFRFPKYWHVVERVVIETTILGRIRKYLTLPTPHFIYRNIEGQTVGNVFIGYPLIPGESLWSETLATIEDEETLQRLAEPLAGFLKELHRVPLEELGLELPPGEGLDEWKQLYSDIRHILFPYMRPRARRQIIDQFETFISDFYSYIYTPCLRHGDFGPSNILYDPATLTITGIIDFDFIGPGDPALDIAAVSSYGEPFLERFYAIYPEIMPMLARARFFKGTYALQEALNGLRDGDKKAFERGIAPYQ